MKFLTENTSIWIRGFSTLPPGLPNMKYPLSNSQKGVTKRINFFGPQNFFNPIRCPPPPSESAPTGLHRPVFHDLITMKSIDYHQHISFIAVDKITVP